MLTASCIRQTKEKAGVTFFWTVCFPLNTDVMYVLKVEVKTDMHSYKDTLRRYSLLFWVGDFFSI